MGKENGLAAGSSFLELDSLQRISTETQKALAQGLVAIGMVLDDDSRSPSPRNRDDDPT